MNLDLAIRLPDKLATIDHNLIKGTSSGVCFVLPMNNYVVNYMRSESLEGLDLATLNYHGEAHILFTHSSVSIEIISISNTSYILLPTPEG